MSEIPTKWVATFAGGATVLAVGSVLLFPPRAKEVQIPPSVVTPSYTPFTRVPTQPTRPPHPIEIYRPPGETASPGR